MRDMVFNGVAIALMIAGLACFIGGVYHLAVTLDNVREERRSWFYFFGPNVLLSGPRDLTEDGIYHRNRFAVFVVLFAFCCGLFAAALWLRG
jgi:hypothetical protein